MTDERRSLINQHFSDAVQELQRELRKIATVLTGIESEVDTSLNAIPHKGLFLEDLRNKYAEPAKSLREELDAIKTWANSVKKRVDQKLANVLTAVESNVDAPPAVAGEDFIKLRTVHNERVSKHDELVQAGAKAIELHYLKRSETSVKTKKTEVATAKGQVDQLNGELAELNTQITALEAVDG
ncbi:hypothetical protein B1A_01358, partial [mine drainage metagenome]